MIKEIGGIPFYNEGDAEDFKETRGDHAIALIGLTIIAVSMVAIAWIALDIRSQSYEATTPAVQVSE